MTCKNCTTKPIWEFTNKTKLCRTCFIDYIERKVFAAVRKFNLLPKDRIFKLKKSNTLNYNILKTILEKKFAVKNDRARFANKNKKAHQHHGNSINSENLSALAEKIFKSILKGNFKQIQTKKSPLYLISDKEIELYAKLRNIKGKSRKKDKRIQNLFQKFSKNPDLEHNIINSFSQL